MPIVEISDIQIKAGLSYDLPNLLEGELSLILDTGEVVIGAPNYPPSKHRSKHGENSKYPYSNIQILTEFTSNIEELLNYSYKFRNLNNNSNYSNTGNILGYETKRKLQEKLDDFVSVLDYGAKGNGRKNYSFANLLSSDIDQETYALRKAALDVSNVTNTNNPNEWHTRKLYFPSGVYPINKPLLLPPNSTWLGDGKNKTVIVLESTPDLEVGFSDCVFHTVDNTLSSNDFSENQIELHSYQNINDSVNNIYIQGITFVTKNNTDIGRLIRCKNVIFVDCEFIGISPEKTGDVNYFDNNTNSIVIDDMNSTSQNYYQNNIYFENCDFKNTTYASCITSNVDTISFNSCTFQNLYRGISIGETIISSSVLTEGSNGPKNIKILNSLFKNIIREGFSVWNFTNSNRDLNDKRYIGVGGNISAFNAYDNVGNNQFYSVLGNPTVLETPFYPCIRFVDGARYNASLMDVFTRDSYPLNDEQSRVYYSIYDSNIIMNMQDGLFINNKKFYKNIFEITNNTGNTNCILNILKFKVCKIKYTCIFENAPSTIRSGTIEILTDTVNVLFNDNYNELNGPSNITFNYSITGNDLTITYNNISGFDAKFEYEIDIT